MYETGVYLLNLILDPGVPATSVPHGIEVLPKSHTTCSVHVQSYHSGSRLSINLPEGVMFRVTYGENRAAE